MAMPEINAIKKKIVAGQSKPTRGGRFKRSRVITIWVPALANDDCTRKKRLKHLRKF
jgi:hypothetical protein